MLKSTRQSSDEKNMQRQAYHGQSFIGNHVNKMLKVNLVLIQNYL